MAKTDYYDFYCEEALSGKIKLKKVYESETVLSFYHTKPAYKTHIVIIPKEHMHDLREANDEVLQEIMMVAKKLLSQVNLNDNTFRLITNLGKGQDTPHLHFHVISDADYQDLKVE